MRKKYFKMFIYRLILFAFAAVVYFVKGEMLNPNGEHSSKLVLSLIWLSVMYEFVTRAMPNRKLSIGCQKEFTNRYKAADYEEEELKKVKKPADKSALYIFIVWILAHAVIWMLYFLKYIAEKELILLVVFYHLADMICVLYWCPFRTFFMKNRCCATCRIFSWDSAMLISPIIVVPGLVTTSLVVFGLFLTLRWEYVCFKHPERFFEVSNRALKCANCTEHLCSGRNRLEARFKRIIKR